MAPICNVDCDEYQRISLDLNDFVSLGFKMEGRGGESKDKRKPHTKTVYEYASVCTPHGISYVFESDRLLVERLLWVLVVCIFAGCALRWSILAFDDWQQNPILTSVATTGYPIEKVEFPAITICAQGAANDVVDAALFKQFDRYLIKKNLNFSELSTEDQIMETKNFLNATYPGAKKTPNQLVRMMGSPDVSVESKLESAAILNTEEFKKDCSSSNNGRKKRDIIYSEETCPDGFVKAGPVGSGSCIHVGTSYMTYNEAIAYCESKDDGNGKLLSPDHDEDIQPILKELHDVLTIGKN